MNSHKSLIALALTTSLLLSSCGSAPVTSTDTTKKIPFAVETRELGSFPTSYTLEKTGRLVGSSSINLASQGIGRVDAVLVKE